MFLFHLGLRQRRRLRHLHSHLEICEARANASTKCVQEKRKLSCEPAFTGPLWMPVFVLNEPSFHHYQLDS